MKSITKVFLFLTVLPIVSSAQPRFIDTLLMRLETGISDSLRMETYFDLSESYYSHHPDSVDKAIFYVDELYDLAKKKDDKRWQVSHFNMKARILQHNKQFEEAIAEYDQGIELAQIIKDTLRAAQIMDNKAGIYASQRRFDEALPIQLEALEYFEQKKDSLSIGICHFGIGFTYNEKGDYEKAILRFKRSHDYFIKNDGARAEIYGNLAKAYREMNSIDSAFHYFELAAQYSKEYPSVYGKNLYELALLHFGKGNYTISLEYLNQIEDIPSYDVGEMDYKFFQLLLGRTHLKMRNISRKGRSRD